MPNPLVKLIELVLVTPPLLLTVTLNVTGAVGVHVQK
jgi:hypothetical protein